MICKHILYTAHFTSHCSFTHTRVNGLKYFNQGCVYYKMIFWHNQVIHSGMSASLKPLFIWYPVCEDGNESFEPESMYNIIFWYILIWYFLCIAFNAVRCIFAFGPFSSPCPIFHVFILSAFFFYFGPNFFCFPYIRLWLCFQTFSLYLHFQFSFVVLECPVVSVLFDPISVCF